MRSSVDFDPCGSGEPAPDATWRVMARPLDGQAEVRAPEIGGKLDLQQLVLDLSGAQGVTSVNLFTSEVQVDRAGLSVTVAMPVVPNAIGSPDTRHMVGTEGRNILHAGEHGTTFEGRGGADALVGGSSADIFRFTSLAQSTLEDYASIYQFGSEDRIEITRSEAMRQHNYTMRAEDRGCGWWQLTIDEGKDGSPEFFAMVETQRLDLNSVHFVD
ncbi:hypothetical protein [Rhodoligotrophos defluvii]|uniref:hypothetical protein n=1 Tax=Rhodoligotrophos defluvii TaxID=2561934 RepID=UPI0010C98CBB|nr:hypothetical protein [Rhodoligotrophos defluvii]